jgi:prepilin-type N-terminal cleavage/methylation domain-containing protein
MFDSREIRCGSGRRGVRSTASGMTLLELLVAMSVLTIGMLGSMIMILTGIQSNARNKTDSTAVVLDQEILEMFATLKNYPKPGWVTINDCALSAGGANAHEASLAQAAGPAGAGAILYTAATAPLPSQVGDIDWTQPTPVLATSTVQGYAMRYQACNGDTYEVRWNVMEVSPNPSSRISMLTVSARQLAAQGSNNGMLFAPPSTLRTLIEN